MSTIKEKTEYCLNCKVKPCSLKGCPLGNNIPQMIQYIKKENTKRVTKQYQKQQYYRECVVEYAHMKNNVKVHV